MYILWVTTPVIGPVWGKHYAALINEIFHLGVVWAESANQALDQLETNPDCALIICQQMTVEGDSILEGKRHFSSDQCMIGFEAVLEARLMLENMPPVLGLISVPDRTDLPSYLEERDETMTCPPNPKEFIREVGKLIGKPTNIL